MISTISRILSRAEHRSLKERTKLDTTMCQEGIRKSQESCPVPVSVLTINTKQHAREKRGEDEREERVRKDDREEMMRDRRTDRSALRADDPPRKIQITHLNHNRILSPNSQITDPLRISLLEELTLPALTHPIPQRTQVLHHFR